MALAGFLVGFFMPLTKKIVVGRDLQHFRQVELDAKDAQINRRVA